MLSRISYLFSACLSLLLLVVADAADKKVAILGDSICYGAHWPALIEGQLRANPEYKNADIVNFGLPSETVSGISDPGHAGGRFPRPCILERLPRILKAFPADLVIACYGMNDGVMLPFDEDRFLAYQQGSARLKKEVEKSGGKIIFVTPSPYKIDQVPTGDAYDKVLERYSDWLVAQRKKGWQVVDMRKNLLSLIAAKKKETSGFTFAGDGVHPGPDGHRLMAEAIWMDLARYLKMDAKAPFLSGAEYDKLFQAHRNMMNAWLTKTKHIRPEIAGYDATVAAAAAKSSPPVKVKTIACIGDSITFGAGAGAGERWSDRLQQVFGPFYKVENYGISARTMLKKGDNPFQKEANYTKALDAKADIYIIALGTNDSKPQNWKFKKEFESDCRSYIRDIRKSNPKAEIYFFQAVPVNKQSTSINDAIVRHEINPTIAKVAASEKCKVVDLYSPLLGKFNLIPDAVHPNGAGHVIMTGAIYKALTGNDLVTDEKTLDWNGYKKDEFLWNGRPALLVQPKQAAEGNPWIWRTEFFGHEPQADLALLAKGYAVAYLDLQDLYGSPASMQMMDGFYRYLVKRYALSTRVVLEGFSRGGLFAFNWAALRPKLVSGLYVDAPVCDIKSWPGGKIGKGKGSAGDWAKLLHAYDFTEEEAMKDKQNPVDNLAPLAKSKVPILAVVGEADDVVPVADNINIVEKRYKQLGGKIQIIRKPGVNHHPHSLTDPKPIVDFVLRLK